MDDLMYLFAKPGAYPLMRTELTQAQWLDMGFPNLAGTLDDGAGGTDCVGALCPASTLGWCEAAEYANRLSRREGRRECMHLIQPRGTVGVDFVCDGATPVDSSYYQCEGYRLPTSGEWEYATRAGTTTAFFSGPWTEKISQCFDLAHLGRVAWYCTNSGGHTHEVCTREPNPWGLFDMVGNAAEYVADTGQHGYGPGPVVDPPLALVRDPEMADKRLTRGSFYHAPPTILRAADQSFVQALAGRYNRTAGIGFRLARTLSQEEAAAWGQQP